jgi:hypothetical protein
MSVPTDPLYLGKRYHPIVFSVLGTMAFLASAYFIRSHSNSRDPNVKATAGILVALWSVLPPLWFFFEHFYYFPKHGNPQAGFAALKSAQDVTAKVWASIAILLAAMYTISFPR